MNDVTSPLVYIVILNWNGLQDTLACLESIYKMSYDNFNVVVVDNNSSDNSVESLKKTHPRIMLIENKENTGYTGGNNVAMKYAMENNADYLWLLNNDTVVEVDTLSKLVSTAEDSNNVGLISPVVYYFDFPDRIQFCGSYIDMDTFSIAGASDLESSEKLSIGRQTCLWGTALLIKAETVNKIGLLDESFFAYLEDTDYSVRALKAGYQNVMSWDAKVFHKNPLRINEKRGEHYYYYMSRNPYYCISSHFQGRGTLTVVRIYIAYLLSHADNFKVNKAAFNVCLDGIWAAMHDVKGPWNKGVRMPGYLKKVLYPLSLCPLNIHYFISALLKGRFSKIVSEVIKRCKANMFEHCVK